MFKKWVQSPIVIIIATLLAISFILSLRKNLSRLTLSEHNLNILRSEVNDLQTEVDNKQQELELAKQPLAKEKIARNELLLKKEGEYVIQLPEIKLPEEKMLADKELSNWEKWEKLLFE